MKINILGGGPGGLYFALLMKKHDPSHEIHLFERGPRHATWGFGVVFSDDTMGGFLEYDAPSFKRIVDSFAYWDQIRTVIETEGGEDKNILSGGHGFAGMSRLKLLNIFHDRCEELGVNLHFETDVTDVDELLGADLVVAADGITSSLREKYKEELGTTIDMRPNRFCWLGTAKPLDAFTFIFRETKHGWFWVHAYQFEEGKATWLVETTDLTWKKSGLDTMSEEDSKAYMEEIFKTDLDGHPLLTNRSVWRTFPVVKNVKWHHDNVIVIGDCAHTAHFSIGSGTKMAMEDAIQLFEAFKANGTVEASLPAYDADRREVTEILQHTADVSLKWFENAERYLSQFDPEQIEFSMITRSKKITFDNLALRDQVYIDGVSQWFAKHTKKVTGLDVDTSDNALVPALQPFTIGNMIVPNRIALSPMCQYCANDGDINDWHLVHYGGRASGGVGLILTEMICISESARITPGCAGLYTASQAEAWRRITDFSHKNGPGKICAQLGHAGRKGATRLPKDGMDQPLKDGAWEIISASSIPYLENSMVPRETNRSDMDKVIEDYRVSVKLADDAGFDMIEVHMAHGYLLSSFISPVTNVRGDEYGGEIYARMRFPLECLVAAREAWPKEKPISVRISACDWVEGGLSEDDMLEVARLLKANGADVINVSTGQVTKAEKPLYGRMFQAPFADQVRNIVGIPTIVAGNISTVDQANTLVASGRTDLVAFGRPLMTNPNMVLQEAARYGSREQHWPEQYTSGKFQAGLLAERESAELKELRINAKPPSPHDALALALGRKELN